MELKNEVEFSDYNQNIDNIYQEHLKDLTSIIDKHTPITRRHITKRKHKTWYDRDALKLNIQMKES